MARTIRELTPGVGVKINERVGRTRQRIEYIYLGLDGSGNARLLRERAVMPKRMHSSNVAHYEGCEADLWHENEETGFLARFDDATIAALRPTKICCQNVADGVTTYPEIMRRAFPMSMKEYGFSSDESDSDFLPALMDYYENDDYYDVRSAVNEDGWPVLVWMRSGSSASQFRFVNSYGGASNGSVATSGGNWQRPAISVSPDTIVSGEDADFILLPDGIMQNCEAAEEPTAPLEKTLTFEVEASGDVTGLRFSITL